MTSYVLPTPNYIQESIVTQIKCVVQHSRTGLHDKATPNQSVSGHPPAWYFENPIYEDYNDTHGNYDVI